MAANNSKVPEYDGVRPAKALAFLSQDSTSEHIETHTTEKANSSKEARTRVTRVRKSKSVAPSDKAKTSLYISQETLHDLRVYCADTGIPMTEFVEDAVKDRLKMEKKKKAKEDRNNGIEE